MPSVPPPPSAAGTCYVLDTHGLIFQMFHGIGPISAPDGRPTNAAFGVTRALMELYDRGADYLLAAFDRAEPTFRTTIDAEYKAHRPPPPHDLLVQEPMIEAILEAMRIPKLSMAGFEADDVMATIAQEAPARSLNVFLCTADKDCRQLLTDKVKIKNLRKGEELDADGLMKVWGVLPNQVVDFQALVGDSVDNVPGVPGVGPVTASKWLKQYGTLDNLIAHADEVGGPKLRDALKAAIANGNLAKSKSLVKLDSNVPLAFDWDGWRRRDWDGERLLALFQEYGFKGFANKVRNTLIGSGAKKNADLLADIGEAPTPAPKPELAVTKPKPSKPSLFEVIDGEAEFVPEGDPDFAFGALAGPDTWGPLDYQCVDTPAKFKTFLTALKKQKRFTFDLETTALDPLRADVVGYAFCWEDRKAYYLPVRGPAGSKLLDPDATLAALKPVFENPAVGKVNQNIKYDQLALRHAGVDLAGVVGDSMIADYLLHSGERSHNLDELARKLFKHENISITELIGKGGKKQLTMDQVATDKVTAYAAEDADCAWRLTTVLEADLTTEGLRKLYDDLEIPLVAVLADIEFNGIRLDVPFLAKLSVEMEGLLAEAESAIHAAAGHPFNVGSPKQLQKVLFEELKLPPQKRTDKGDPSTDFETLEKLAAMGHELPRRVIEYRGIAKLKGTYVDALPALVNPDTGRLHTSFNQAIAATGRLSSTEPNLQNVPARTEQGKQIRKAFVPPDGWRIVTADYSQVELRLLAHFCRDERLVEAFAQDRDVHASVAAEVYKVPEDQVTADQRRVAKMVNFGVIYGMTASGLAVRLGMKRKDAEQFIDDYFAKFPKVLNYQDDLLAKARKTGSVGTLLGRRRRFDPSGIRPQSSYQNRTGVEREAINMEIQGSAADLMKLAMLEVHRRLKAERLEAKMLLTVHDELVFECPPAEVSALAKLAREAMSGAMTLDVPLRVDVAAGPNWLDVEDV